MKFCVWPVGMYAVGMTARWSVCYMDMLYDLKSFLTCSCDDWVVVQIGA